MKCPACNVALVMSERQGIEIDYCPECRGIWLDRGELDKIIQRSATEAPAPVQQQAPPPPQAPPQQGYPQQHGYAPQHGYGHKPHKRHKHWLEEIFD
jgi:Zn-finger nucleic acid-binding protein